MDVEILAKWRNIEMHSVPETLKKIMKAKKKKTREIKFETKTMEFLFFKFPNSWSLFHSFDF